MLHICYFNIQRMKEVAHYETAKSQYLFYVNQRNKKIIVKAAL